MFSASNIRTRHSFLQKLVGTKPQEDISLDNTNQLLSVLTVCILTFSVLEIGLYFLYNKKV